MPSAFTSPGAGPRVTGPDGPTADRFDGPPGDRDFVQSLARGLAVIQCFGADAEAQTLSEVARRSGVSRAAARRLLHTLVVLGHAETDGRLFRLRPRVLDLGFSYLHAQGLWAVAQPYMVELVERVHESCSAAVLDGRDIVYVARVPIRARIMSISLGPGSRLPAHATSMGRVLLAELPEAQLDAFVEALSAGAGAPGSGVPRAEGAGAPGSGVPRAEGSGSPTPGAPAVDSQRLRKALARARAQGYAIVDQELERGLRSIAVPIRDASGRAAAALNVSTQASRTSLESLERRILPALRDTAQQISRAWGAQRA